MSKRKQSSQGTVVLKGVSFVKAPTLSSQNSILSSDTLTSEIDTSITRDEFMEALEKVSRPNQPRREKGKSQTSG